MNNGYWIFGLHAVEETLEAKPTRAQKIWVERGKEGDLSVIFGLAQKAGVPIERVDRGRLDHLSDGTRHQGVGAFAAMAPSVDLKSYLKGLSDERKKDALLVALDQIQDPHNLGAIARSAANLGAQGLMIGTRRSASAGSIAARSSAGAIQKIQIFEVINLTQALEDCRKAGFWLYGADGAGKSIWQVRFNRPLVLVIGAEGEGMRRLVRETVDEVVAIPQSPGGVESFNASCAASILLYEIARQKQSSELSGQS